MKRSAMTVSGIIIRSTLLGHTAPFGGNGADWLHGVADRHCAALHSGFLLSVPNQKHIFDKTEAAKY